MRIPRGLAILMMGLGGLFGMRTPPEPTVAAQMQPAKGYEGKCPEPPPQEDMEAPRIVQFPKK